MPEAILAPIIIGSVTLLTVLINVASAQSIRYLEKKDKRYEWLVEKQNRDLEEIISTLNRFLKDFSNVAGELELKQHTFIEQYTIWRYELSYGSADVDPTDFADYVETSKGALITELRKYNETYRRNAESFAELAAVIKIWFNFDAKRLSVWFDETDNIEETLSSIGKKFRSAYVNLIISFHTFERFARELETNKSKLTEHDVAGVQELHSQTNHAMQAWVGVNNDIVRLQRTLVSRFKPPEINYPADPTNDGVFVQAARLTERRLRQLIRLR